MRSLLCIIYTGKAYLKKQSIQDIQDLMRLLDIKLPGDFVQEESAGTGSPSKHVFDTPCSSMSSAKRKLKSPSKIYLLDDLEPVSKAPRVNDDKKSYEKLLIEMTQSLMPFELQKNLNCNVPGCLEKVNHSTMSAHFQKHIEDRDKCQSNKRNSDIVMFKCSECPKEFRFRRALDHHKQKYHSAPKPKHSEGEETLPMKDGVVDTPTTLNDKKDKVYDTPLGEVAKKVQRSSVV